MIEVFKTDIRKISQAKKLVALLLQHFPGNKINIDFHDCDKILRIEGGHFLPGAIANLVNDNGFVCIPLE